MNSPTASDLSSSSAHRAVRFSTLAIFVAVLLTACSRTPQQKEAKFLELGRKHLESFDYQSALLDFKSAIQVMPKDAEPHYQLGLTELNLGYAQAAVNEFRRAVELDPKHIAAQLKLAELMGANKNPDIVREAEKKAQAILAIDPGNPDALQALAAAELRLGDAPADAIAHLEEAIERVPQHLGSAMTLAMEKLRKNDLPGAEKVMLASAAAAPSSPEHAVVLGQFYLLIHKPQEAERQFRRALDLDAANGPALNALGSMLYQAGKLDEAGQFFERASRLPAPQYRPLYAKFLLETGKRDAAIAEFERLYKADRTDRDARGRLIAAYLKSNRISDARSILDEAIKRNPQDAEARLERGDLLLVSGRYREADADLTQALRFQADKPATHLAMSKLHQVRGETDQQIQELTEALRLDPGMLSARLSLAQAYVFKHSPNLALEVLNQAPDKDNKDPRLIAERNNVFFALGDYAGLRKGIAAGLAISRSPVILYQDGLLRLKLKDYQGSRASLEEVLRQQPQDWKAVEALALTYLAEKRTADATRVVKQYTSAAPNSAGAQEFLGLFLVRAGDLAGARAAFQAEKSLAPADPKGDLNLAMLDFNEKKFDSARNTLTNLLNRDPHNLSALLQLAQLEQQTGRPAEAIVYYEKAVQENPNNPPALNNLAFLLADSGKDPDRALTLAQQVKQLLPNSPTVDDTIGWAYYKKGLFHPALDHLKVASNSPLRMYHLAMTYFQLGDRYQAYTTLQAAMRADSSLPEAKEAKALLGQTQ